MTGVRECRFALADNVCGPDMIMLLVLGPGKKSCASSHLVVGA